MKRWIRRTVTTTMMFCAALASPAQTPQDSKAAIKPDAPPDYSRESQIIDRCDDVYSYKADGTGYRQRSIVVRLQDAAAAKNWSVLQQTFAGATEKVEYTSVRVIHKDGSVTETPGTDVQVQPTEVTREAPFYSDQKQAQLPVRSLAAGDRLEYTDRVTRTRAEAPGQFWGSIDFFTLSSKVVVLQQSMELRVPAGVYVNVSSPRLAPVQTNSGTEVVYRWLSSQTTPVAGLKDQDIAKKLPPEELTGEPVIPLIAWTTFKSWQQVGEWYRSMAASRTAASDAVKQKTTELTAAKTSDDDRARALYNYVAPQIRYIGVAFGIGRYQPHEADEVLRNEYGDCKDKHTLLASMMGAAGLQADAVLIGPGLAFSEAVPSPEWFNHVITQAHIGGKEVLLDATSELAPFGLLLSTEETQRALVIPDKGEPHLITVRRQEPYALTEDFRAIGKLDTTGTSVSTIELTLRDDAEVALRTVFRQVPPASWDELMQRLSYGFGYAGTVKNVTASRPEDTAAPFRITYTYTRERDKDWDNKRFLPQLFPAELPSVDEKDPPVTPIKLGQLHVLTSHSEMTLPEGWSAELPAAIHAKAEWATVDTTFRAEKGAVIVDRRVELLQDKVPAAKWKEYQKWYKDAGLDAETYIELSGGGGSSVNTVSNADAAAKVEEARSAARRRNFDEAEQRLKEAEALNPVQADLWALRGSIALNYGKAHEARDDFEKEIANHPSSLYSYQMLAASYEMQHDLPAAKKALYRLLSVSPGNYQGTTLLAGVLDQEGSYEEESAVLRRALTTSPDSAALKLQLGRALLASPAGKAEGTKLLTEIIDTSTEPGPLNDASYELANHGGDLQRAEQGVRKAIAKLKDSAATANDESSRKTLLSQSQLMIAIWDSLGWILKLEGKTEEAEQWIRPSWLLGQHMEVGLHLGEVLATQGKRDEAMHVFELAEAAQPGPRADQTRKTLKEKMTGLEKSGVKKGHVNARTELQDARTVPVRMLGTVTGSGTFYVLANESGVVNVRMGEGDEAMRSYEDVLLHMQLQVPVPKGSGTQILRTAIVSCHASCMLVWAPVHN